jgi:hypothetical protein
LPEFHGRKLFEILAHSLLRRVIIAGDLFNLFAVALDSECLPV